MKRRRGLVLLAVLVVIVLASLVGTTVLIVADADRSGAEVSLRRTQSRALAWSGVRAVTAELANQRDGILDGRPPRITEEWVVTGADGDPVHGVFRLIGLGEDGPLQSESGKLDLNLAPEEVLSGLPGVSADLAARIVAARTGHALGSPEELLSIDGVTPELFYGPTESEGSGPSRGSIGLAVSPLADLVTVFSADPNVQVGLGSGGQGHRGELRLNINTPWSERLEQALVRRFDRAFADGVKSILSQRSFKDDGDIVAVLNEFNVEPAEWVQTFDVFTTSPDEFLYGRVDLNAAPAEVLACIPGIDAAAAGRIVTTRGLLEAEALKSVSWPAAEGVLTPEQFQQAAKFLTTRSMQWRVRVEAGFEAADEVGTAPSGGDAPKLRDRIVLEAVIDIASERPRVAYLREVTLLDVARRNFESAEGKQAPAEGVPLTNRAGQEGAPADERDADAQGPTRLTTAPQRRAAAERVREQRSIGRTRLRTSGPETWDSGPEDEGSSSEERPGAIQEAGPDRRMGRWNPARGGQGGQP